MLKEIQKPGKPFDVPKKVVEEKPEPEMAEAPEPEPAAGVAPAGYISEAEHCEACAHFEEFSEEGNWNCKKHGSFEQLAPWGHCNDFTAGEMPEEDDEVEGEEDEEDEDEGQMRLA